MGDTSVAGEAVIGGAEPAHRDAVIGSPIVSLAGRIAQTLLHTHVLGGGVRLRVTTRPVLVRIGGERSGTSCRYTSNCD